MARALFLWFCAAQAHPHLAVGVDSPHACQKNSQCAKDEVSLLQTSTKTNARAAIGFEDPIASAGDVPLVGKLDDGSWDEDLKALDAEAESTLSDYKTFLENRGHLGDGTPGVPMPMNDYTGVSFLQTDKPKGNKTKKDCTPKCHWNCKSPPCEEVCKPKCKPPKCKTRCDQLDVSKCHMECLQPHCVVVCPKTSCLKDDCDCPDCITNCTKPCCKMECDHSCHNVCDPPECEWNCTAPKVCPKPDCTMECEGAPATPECQDKAASFFQTSKREPMLLQGYSQVDNFEVPQSVLENQATSLRVPVTTADRRYGGRRTRFVDLPVAPMRLEQSLYGVTG